MYHLYIIAGVALIVSLIADRQKTVKAFKMALKRFGKILPAMLVMLVLASFLPVNISDTVLLKYLGDHNLSASVLFAALLGSIALLPGFIVFPLCGILLGKGVSYMVLSAFTTTLMMVGVITYPVEKAYLGHKVTILRNALSFGIALVVALMTGIVFGEVW